MLIAVEGPGSAYRHEVAVAIEKALKKVVFSATLLNIEQSPFIITPNPSIDPETEMLARVNHLRWVSLNTIKTADKSHGYLVIEKFTANLIAYYGGCKKLSSDWVGAVAECFIDKEFRPDLTVFVSADHDMLVHNRNPHSLLTPNQHIAYEQVMEQLWSAATPGKAFKIHIPVCDDVQVVIDKMVQSLIPDLTSETTEAQSG